MEKRKLPLSPVKDSNIQSPDTCSVTPNGKALRKKVALGVKRCIAAPVSDEDKENLDAEDEFGPEVLTSSPQSLTRVLYARAMNEVKAECHKFGVLDEKVESHLDKARCVVGAQALLRQLFATKPSEDEEKDFKRLAQFFHESGYQLRYDATLANAVNEGTTVIANKAEMDKLTPLQRAAVYAHEIMHGKNEDGAYRIAFQDEFVAQNKYVEFLIYVANILYRTQETFADLGVAARAPNLAKGITEFRQAILQERGPGVPTTHPANDAWAELDATMVELHAKYKEELARKERCMQMNKRLRGLSRADQVTDIPKK